MNQVKNIALLFAIAVSLVFAVSCVDKQVPATETYYETEYRTEYKTESYTVVEDSVVKTVEGADVLDVKSRWRWDDYLYDYYGRDISALKHIGDYYGYDISALKHTRSQVQISFAIAPQLNKGTIKIVDLTDACSDKGILYANWIFGKESMVNTNIFFPAEGCQLSFSLIAQVNLYTLGPSKNFELFRKGVDSLLNMSVRNLGEFPIGDSKGDSITFDAKGVKEFAIFVSTELALNTPNVTLTWADDTVEKRAVTKERQVPYQVPVQVEKQRPATGLK
jgi:hypothetical protein